MVSVHEVLANLVSNRRLFIEKLITIEDKQRISVPFQLNAVQEDFFYTQTGRDLILKASQLGFTSIIIADFLADTITHPGTTTVIVAHEEFITQRLLNKAQKFYDSIVPDLKPEMHHSSSYEKTFPDIGSVLYIGTAGAKVFGRGETIHNFLGSEVAFWPDPEKIIVPIMQRVPRTGRIILESTPNGEENFFHYQWSAARSGQETDSGVFFPHFYPWWLNPEYQLAEGDPYALKRDQGRITFFADDELRLMELHGLTENHIRWRRKKIQEMEILRLTGESRVLFLQEYPEDDETCFLVSGESVYDQELLKMHSDNCYPAPKSYNGAQVWFEPEENHNYIVAVDPGQAANTKTAITVWDFIETPDYEIIRHCATRKGLIPTDRTAIEAMDIARYYNRALLAVESNGHGLAVTNAIGDYPRLYWRTDIETGATKNKIGWMTTTRTKPFMISEMQRALRTIETHDINLVMQLRNARWKGKVVEFMGEDDIHDSAAIALVCRPDKPVKKGLVGSAGWKW